MLSDLGEALRVVQLLEENVYHRIRSDVAVKPSTLSDQQRHENIRLKLYTVFILNNKMIFEHNTFKELSTFQFLNKPGSTFLWKLVLVEQ
jgi:hypothetical protein